MATRGAGSGEEDVGVNFGANIDDLVGKFGQVGTLFEGLTKKFTAFAAVLGGGVAFKSFIDEANRVNVEAEKMSRTMGITASEAGVLAVALDDIGAKLGTSVNVDTYTGAFAKFNQALRTQSYELRALGVDVDAVQSGQKTSNEVFLEALQMTTRYRAGIDQTQVSMRLFGRSVEDVQALALLNQQALDDARQSAEELNLTISAEGVASATRYRVAIDNVGDVLQGMRVTIGEGVLPLFSEMGEAFAEFGPSIVAATQQAVQTFVAAWRTMQQTVSVAWQAVGGIVENLRTTWEAVFGRDGPDAMGTFTNALRLVEAAFIAFRVGVEVISITVRALLTGLGANFAMIADVATAAFSLDWDGVKSAWRRNARELEAIIGDGIADAAEAARRGAAEIEAALVDPRARPTRTPAGSSATTGTGTADLDVQQQHASAKASLVKVQSDTELALQQEFLRQEQAISDEAFRQNLVDLKKYYDDKLQIELAGIDMIIEAKRREAEQSRAAAVVAAAVGKEGDRLAALTREAQALGEIAVLEARRTEAERAGAVAFAEAQRARQNALDATRADRDNDRAQDAVSEERARIDQMRALRQIDADQAFALQRAAEDRSYAATEQFLQAKRALLREGDLQGQVELNAEIEAAERAHQSKLGQISRDATLERARDQMQAQQGVQNAFADSLNSIMGGVTKMRDVFRNFGLAVATTFQNLIAQRFAERIFGAGSEGGGIIGKVTQPIMDAVDTIVRKWILGQTTMTAATVAQTQARTAAEATASEESLIMIAAKAIKSIAIAAWESAAWVYAAIARIPYVGPFLAPAMAIAAAAAVIGFGANIASAEGGWWQIPGDQVAQVHKNEMVLPAKEAQGVRDLVQGRTSQPRQQVTLGGVSGEQFFIAKRGDLQRVLKEMSRDFRK